MKFYPDEDDEDKDEDTLPIYDNWGNLIQEKKPKYEYNPSPFTDGHNPFGEGGIYSAGDPGL